MRTGTRTSAYQNGRSSDLTLIFRCVFAIGRALDFAVQSESYHCMEVILSAMPKTKTGDGVQANSPMTPRTLARCVGAMQLRAVSPMSNECTENTASEWSIAMTKRTGEVWSPTDWSEVPSLTSSNDERRGDVSSGRWNDALKSSPQAVKDGAVCDVNGVKCKTSESIPAPSSAFGLQHGLPRSDQQDFCAGPTAGAIVGQTAVGPAFPPAVNSLYSRTLNHRVSSLVDSSYIYDGVSRTPLFQQATGTMPRQTTVLSPSTPRSRVDYYYPSSGRSVSMPGPEDMWEQTPVSAPAPNCRPVLRQPENRRSAIT